MRYPAQGRRFDDHFWMFEAGRDDGGDWFFMLRLGEYGVRSSQHGVERYHAAYPEHVDEWRRDSQEVEA